MIDESKVKKYNYRQFCSFLLIISASFFTSAFLHLFASFYLILVIFKVLRKFKFLENMCVDITCLRWNGPLPN